MLSIVASLAGAQGPDVEMLSARVFDIRDGLPRTRLNHVSTLSDGSLWLGTDHGAYQFDGHRWTALSLPDSIQPRVVLDIAMTADGARWLAMRGGLLRDSAGVQQWYPVPQAPVWSMVVTRALGDEPTLVIATRDGALRWTGRNFEPLRLPRGFSTVNLMVAASVRDGTHALWLGSLRGGVARWANGRWTVFGVADGLSDTVQVEHLHAPPPGDSVEVVVAGREGLHGFVRGRWRLLHRGQGYLRSVRFKNAGRFETWASVSNGDLLSDGGTGRWHRVAAIDRAPSGMARTLMVMPDRDESSLIFVGHEGGELLRFRIGSAVRVAVPVSFANRAVRTIVAEGPSVHVGMMGNGMLGWTGSRMETVQDSIAMMATVRSTTVRGGGLWMATHDHGVWRAGQQGWQFDPSSPRGGPLTAIGDGLGPAGQPALIAGNAPGRLYVRGEAEWTRFPELPFSGRVAGILTDTIDGQPTMLVAAGYGIWRYDGARWREVRLPIASRDADIVSIARQTSTSRPARVWVLTRGAGLLRIDAADSAVLVPLANDVDDDLRQARALAIAEDGDLLVGTTNGLLKLAESSDGTSVQVAASLANEDGLPHNEVTAVARGDGQWVWVGTLAGIARVSTSRFKQAAETGVLAVAVRRADGVATEIANGDVLPWAQRDLRFKFALRTDYREDDIFYRYELAGPVPLSQPWSLESSASLRALPAGDYTLRVWGIRRYGVPVGPVTRTFRIAPSPWVSPAMRFGYVLAVCLGLWGVVRWRTAVLERRHRALVEQERRSTENERRFRVLFEESADAQLLTDGQVVVTANSAAALLLNDDRDVQPLRGQHVAALMPQLKPGDRVDMLDGRETTVLTLRGETRPVLLRCTDMPHDGTDMAFIELRDLRDVRRLEAEREQLEHQLRESQRLEALGTLAGGVAHDFNNLLTVIRNGAVMAQVAAEHGECDRESLAAIHQAGSRASDLVGQILTFSRRAPTRRDLIAVHAMLQELKPILRASLPATIHMIVEEGAHDAVVLGDQTQLTQVLLNLATNAEHALRGCPNPMVTIRTDLLELSGSGEERGSRLPVGSYLRLRVTDNGVGMREEVRVRVFEPFFTTKAVGEGTGLGLSVLYGIVVGHGGAVSVRSAPTEGTSFEILLPLAEASGTPVPSTGIASPPSTAIAPLRVLLADDDPLVLGATRRLLQHHGFGVTACSAARDVIALVEGSEHFDVLVTDYTMPDMTGDVLAVAVHARRPALPVILVTGVASEVRTSAHRAGISEVLQKPYHMHDLAAAIDRARREPVGLHAD